MSTTLTASEKWMQSARTRAEKPPITVRPPYSSADVLKPTQAAKRLPMCEKAARAWLRTSGLVHRIEDRDFVIWGEVLRFIADPTEGGIRFLDGIP